MASRRSGSDESRSDPPPTVIVATELRGAHGGVETAAAVGVAAAGDGLGGEEGGGDRVRPGGVLVAELSATAGARRATLLASDSARRIEDGLKGLDPALSGAAARGRLCWGRLPDDPGSLDLLAAALAEVPAIGGAVVHLPAGLWSEALERLGAGGVAISGALLRADLPSDRALAALAVGELRDRGLRVRVASRPPGRVAARRALAGIEPGGEASRRAERLACGLFDPRRARLGRRDAGTPR